MARVGLLGGTFDPVHVGHVLLATYMRERVPLDRVVFVPAAVPPHKVQSPNMASAEDRWEMVRRAIAAVDGLAASRIELERSGPSYTVDTLAQLQATHPQWLLFLVIGEDNIAQIPSWYRPEAILSRCTVVAGTRSTRKDRGGSMLASGERIQRVSTPAFDISSTEIRARVRSGRSIRYLVPEDVERYIRQRGLYRNASADAAAG